MNRGADVFGRGDLAHFGLGGADAGHLGAAEIGWHRDGGEQRDDEHDHEAAAFIRPDGDRNGKPIFAVRALTRIEDFNEFFECELADEEYDTIGGLVMHELGRLPRRGEKVEFSGFEFVIVKADKRRVDALQVQRNG